MRSHKSLKQIKTTRKKISSGTQWKSNKTAIIVCGLLGMGIAKCMVELLKIKINSVSITVPVCIFQ